MKQTKQVEKPNDLNQFIFDERFIIDHLVSLIDTTRLSPISKKVKINSCSSYNGKFVYYDTTVVWNLVKNMYIELCELEKPSNELIRTTINYMLENKFMYKFEIVVTNKDKPMVLYNCLLSTYRFYHEKLYKTDEEIMLIKRNSENLKNLTVFEEYFERQVLPKIRERRNITS